MKRSRDMDEVVFLKFGAHGFNYTHRFGRVGILLHGGASDVSTAVNITGVLPMIYSKIHEFDNLLSFFIEHTSTQTKIGAVELKIHEIECLLVTLKR